MFEQMTETDKAYMAGIIDGEGSIMLKHYVQKSRNRVKNYDCYSLLVSVGNTSTELLDWLSQFGGKVYLQKCSVNSARKTLYQWQIHTRQAAELLFQILPYLIIKKSKANAALFFQEIRGNTRHRSDEDRQLDKDLKKLISPGRSIE